MDSGIAGGAQHLCLSGLLLVMHAPPRHVFCFYRDSPARRDMLQNDGDPALRSYLFFGADALRNEGWQVETNLTRRPGTISHHLGVFSSRLLVKCGGYGGDFASCFRNLWPANRSGVVWSTVDTLGIPLAFLRRLGALRRPLLYCSIGLPERMAAMPECFAKRWQIRSLARSTRILCYGWEESRLLHDLLGRDIDFVPFAVDSRHWVPKDLPKSVDLLSLGVDTMRDFAQLMPFAAANPSRKVRIIGNPDQLAALRNVPANVDVSAPVPLSDIADEMARARVIALPVRENSYSGATTTLLQAMSMALPVLVSDVGAIRGGYGFREEESCGLIPPGDADSFTREITRLLDDPGAAAALGARARAHVVRDLDWSHFQSRIQKILADCIETDS